MFLKKLAGQSWRILREESGTIRLDARGHEHFGFADGISQPGVRGQIDRAFPGRTFFNPGLNENDENQGLPGQDIIWPGAFVFGYPGEGAATDKPPAPNREGGPAWMRNGSFQVYRRLRQFVPEFHRFAQDQATELRMDAGLLEARMVGRWPSGAPLVTATLQDDPLLGADAMHNNGFEYSQDRDGRRCPFAAHIRKTYPRDDINPNLIKGNPTEFDPREASESFAEQRRILRAGIPFGKTVSDEEQRTGISDGVQDRGLMFISYQTSIQDQFEFILKAWVNSPDFARAGVGQDPLLGQAGGNRERSFSGALPAYPAGNGGQPIVLPADFIVPTGGGYFFVPSLDTLTSVFAKGGGSDNCEVLDYGECHMEDQVAADSG